MDWTLFWTAFAAIGQFIAFPALLFAAWTFFRAAKIQHYDDLDDMYADLLKAALDKPYLRSPKKCESEAQREEYSIYAFMIWNFLETIFDRIGSDSDLKTTWMPIVIYEADTHREWFHTLTHHCRFKESFHKQMGDIYSCIDRSISRQNLQAEQVGDGDAEEAV